MPTAAGRLKAAQKPRGGRSEAARWPLKSRAVAAQKPRRGSALLLEYNHTQRCALISSKQLRLGSHEP